MNGRTGFAVVAVVVLVAASMVPVVGSQHQIEPGEGGREGQREPGVAGAAARADAEMVEVPVQIHMRDGVKEVAREIPVGEARELLHLLNETRDALRLLHDSDTSPEQRRVARAVIDTFLHKLKEHGLLGDMSIQRARELITGKTRMENGEDAEEMGLMAHLFRQRGWEVNTMCAFMAWGAPYDFHPWNFINTLLGYLPNHKLPPLLELLKYSIPAIVIMLLDWVPHPTTIGYWLVYPFSSALLPENRIASIKTTGLQGKQGITTKETLSAFTLGFTGVVIGGVALGVTLFTAFKKTSGQAMPRVEAIQ